MTRLHWTSMPFLYPSLLTSPSRQSTRASRKTWAALGHCLHSTATSPTSPGETTVPISSHLDPLPDDYSSTIFQDRCTIAVRAGGGGNGCVSFLREKYIEDGPPNGGDGGSGGNLWIQAVAGLTSLHKIARRGMIKAGRGQGGQGKSQGGQRGEDAVLQVPVGTVVREISRSDPVAAEEEERRLLKGSMEPEDADKQAGHRRDKWVLYPGSAPSDFATMEFPPLPKPRKSNLFVMQPKAPISLDLSEHMEKPMLLAAGGTGGLGNPHFHSRTITRPKFATRGDRGIRLELELELKLLADIGLVGLPNAGKSTLLRSLTNSRTRIGNWAFTTLSPNIGTVVLDNHEGRPRVKSAAGKPLRTNFTVADIPGLVEDAHLDKGLGHGFLRHVERARVLAFVVDLSKGDAVLALQNLWKEVGEYETFRNEEISVQTEERLVDWTGFDSPTSRFKSEHGLDITVVHPSPSRVVEPLRFPPISSKPWFVVATKADLAQTQENFSNLQMYLQALQDKTLAHPSGRENGWSNKLGAIPVSAIRGQGVERIPEWIVGLLDT